MSFKKLIMYLVLALSLTSCNNNPKDVEKNEASQASATDLNKYDTVIYDYFDTVTTFMAYTKDEAEFKKYEKILEENLEKYHKLFNTYYDFDGVNNVRTINHNRGKEPVKVDSELINMLKYCLAMDKETKGKINIAMGPVLNIWHNYREEAIANPDAARLPSDEELKEALAHTDINNLIIDEEKSTVFLKDPEGLLDVGAIGKGYAIKVIESELKKAGLKHGILSVGGDDVIIGENPTKINGLWKIAIQNPDLTAQNPYSSIINVVDNSVVTSGDYQRFYKVDGKTYHHIIDPDTLYPSEYFRSVSVVHPDIALADTLSTYLFMVDYETGLAEVKKHGAEAFWIDKSNKEYKTDGWDKMAD